MNPDLAISAADWQPSFPRRRESISPEWNKFGVVAWIPAYAGMTLRDVRRQCSIQLKLNWQI